MRRGTTPTIHLLIDDIDLTACRSVYVTMRQVGANKQYILDDTCGNVEIYKHEIRIRMSQQDTLKFKEGPVMVQVRAVTHNDIAVATDIKSFSLGRILLDGEIG